MNLSIVAKLLIATVLAVAANSSIASELPESAQAPTATEESTDMAAYLALRNEQLREAETGRYGRISRSNMIRLRDAHASLQRLLEGRTSAFELSQVQRVELFNAQETMREILTRQNESAIRCEHTRSMGSQIVEARCASRTDIERRRLAEEEVMRRFTHHIQLLR